LSHGASPVFPALNEDGSGEWFPRQACCLGGAAATVCLTSSASCSLAGHPPSCQPLKSVSVSPCNTAIHAASSIVSIMNSRVHFENFDDDEVYNRSRQKVLQESTRNFVVTFGKDAARIAFDLRAKEFGALLETGNDPDTPVRWMYVAGTGLSFCSLIADFGQQHMGPAHPVRLPQVTWSKVQVLPEAACCNWDLSSAFRTCSRPENQQCKPAEDVYHRRY
jgi:hypothetical protein